MFNVRFEIEFTKIVDIVLKQKLFVLILATSISIITALYLNIKSPIYETTLHIRIPESQQRVALGKKIVLELSSLYDCEVIPIKKIRGMFSVYSGLFKVTTFNTSDELSMKDMKKIIEYINIFNSEIETTIVDKLDDIEKKIKLQDNGLKEGLVKLSGASHEDAINKYLYESYMFSKEKQKLEDKKFKIKSNINKLDKYKIIIGDVKSQIQNTNRRKIIIIITSLIIGLVLSILILVFRQFITKSK